MEKQALDTVVREVYSETRQLWEHARSQLSKDQDHAFKILYSPPVFEPAVLVIGLQPGGDVTHMRHAELERPSETNEYLDESWPLAVQLRKRFGKPFLEGAVGTNAIFFRSPSWADWHKIEPLLRARLEVFCVGENKRLIRAMRPKQIVLLGWDALHVMGGSGFRESVANAQQDGRSRRKRLLQSGEIEGIPAFAIPHPSAAWKNPPVSDDDWTMILAGMGMVADAARCCTSRRG
ncbi:MAG: hypothetical protein ABSC92_08205 [Rhizomicrobium sp.]|jgi:hypothetical protein